MTPLLDGVPLPGYDHQIRAQGQIERKDLSGAQSSTAGSHGGWKAWVLNVTCRVDKEQPNDLLALRRLFTAEAGQDGGEGEGRPKRYRITEETAAALGIFHVRFTDFFKVAPDDSGQRRWEVRFTLVEERSIPERRAERRSEAVAAEAEPPPGAEGADGSPAEALALSDSAMAWLEKWDERAAELLPYLQPPGEASEGGA